MKYRTIVIDPPWPQDVAVHWNKGHSITTSLRAARPKYKTIPLKDIHDIKLSCEAQCHVFLWTTPRFIHEAFHVLESWGVKYIDTITWYKPTAGFPAGNIRRHAEFVLYGYIGKFERIKNPIPAVIKTKTLLRHSEKPAEFYRCIVKSFPAPRLDMFARKRHHGFDSIGNQVEDNYIQSTLDEINNDYTQEVLL